MNGHRTIRLLHRAIPANRLLASMTLPKAATPPSPKARPSAQEAEAYFGLDQQKGFAGQSHSQFLQSRAYPNKMQDCPTFLASLRSIAESQVLCLVR